MSFSSIRNLLGGAARRAGITRDLSITHALQACQRELVNIFGVEYSKFAEPVSVRADASLIVSCRSPAVAQTIRLHEEEILRAVRSAADRLRIDRLFLVPRSPTDVQTDAV